MVRILLECILVSECSLNVNAGQFLFCQTKFEIGCNNERKRLIFIKIVELGSSGSASILDTKAQCDELIDI